MRFSKSVLIGALSLSWGLTASTLAGDEADYANVLKQRGSAYVIIKFVLKMESSAGSRELETEITGVMIDANGLVLASSNQLGTPRFLRGYGNAVPRDIKVLIGDDTKGLPAKVLARDTELDLAWVQIKDTDKKHFDYVDLASSTVPELGQRLLFIRRLGKYFDRVATVTEARLAGKTHKPRDLYVPGPGTLEPGLPIYNVSAQPVGIVVLQLPDSDEIQSNPSAFAGLARDISNGLILPATDVIKATERAKRGELKGDPEESTSKAAEDKDEKEPPKAKAPKPTSRPAYQEDEDE